MGLSIFSSRYGMLTGSINSSVVYGSNHRQSYEDNFTNEEKIFFFVKSKKFQAFCNTPSNGVFPNCLIQITVSQDKDNYSLGNGENISDFKINIREKDGLRNYKMGKFITRPTSTRERRVYHAELFYVTRTEGGRWVAEKLMADNAPLVKKEVEKTHQRLSELRDYVYISTKLKMADVTLEDGSQVSALAWVSETMNIYRQKRCIVTLLDNGKTLDLAAVQVKGEEIKPVEGRIFKSKFVWYQYFGQGKFEIMK